MNNHLQLAGVVSRERIVSSHERRGAFLWQARFKLLLVVAAAGLNVGLAVPKLSATLMLLGLALLAWSRPPGRQAVVFLLIPLWPIVVTVAGFALGFGVTPIMRLGDVVFYREGLLLGGSVALRVGCDIVWLALLVLTTPFPELIQALRWLRVPAILVDTLAMIYRYGFLLHDEFVRMRTASQSRGGRSSGSREMRTMARITAQIFMRVFDRSERIALATFSRGGQ